MKKIKLSFLFLLVSCSSYAQVYSNVTIYTPSNVPVSALQLVSGDLTSDQKNDSKNFWLSCYNNRITFISEATCSYNCHAYAWYTSEGGANVWINSPGDNTFWSDLKYVEVPSQVTAAKVSFGGPCYQFWTTCEGTSYTDPCDHSAIITSTTDYFISKWGQAPLFRHHKNDCPYSTQDIHYYAIRKVSGPTTLCSSGGSYTISNVPSGATITWSCGPEIQRQSAQGANPCTFRSISDGDSYVQASITYNGQTIALPGFNVYSGLPPAPPDRYAANVDGYDGYYTKILNSGTAYFTMTNTSSFGKWWDTQWATSTTHGGNDYYLDIDADVLGTNYVLPYWTNACGISAPGPSVILEVILGKSANQGEISFGLSPNPAEQYVDIKLNLPADMEAVGAYWAEFVNPYSVVAKKVELDGPENRVGVADLPKGYYVVKLRIGKEIYTNKLVIE